MHETAHKTPSFYSASSMDSGIDLDEKTKTSITDRSIILDSCHNQSINSCQKNEKQEKPQRRKFNRARCLAIFEPAVISVLRICFIQSLCKRKQSRSSRHPPCGCSSPPGAAGKGTTSSRPSDEKRNFRISMASSTQQEGLVMRRKTIDTTLLRLRLPALRGSKKGLPTEKHP